MLLVLVIMSNVKTYMGQNELISKAKKFQGEKIHPSAMSSYITLLG